MGWFEHHFVYNADACHRTPPGVGMFVYISYDIDYVFMHNDCAIGVIIAPAPRLTINFSVFLPFQSFDKFVIDGWISEDFFK